MATTIISCPGAAVKDNAHAYEVAVALDPVTGDYEINVIAPDRTITFVGYAATRIEAIERGHQAIARAIKRRGGAR